MKVRARSVYFFLGAVLSLLMADWALNNSYGDQTVQGEIKNLTVTEKDNGSRFELNRGNVLTLRLESNPSTGYSWQIAENDGKVMELMGEPTYETPERKLIVGGIEYRIYRFKALTRGTNVLELQYRRIWEKEKEPLKTFRITVKID